MQDIKPYQKPAPPQPPRSPVNWEPQLPLGKPEPLLPAKSHRHSPSIRPLYIWLGIVVVVLLGLLGAAIAVVGWYNAALQPASSINQRITVTIESGASPNDIATELAAKKLIKNSTAFYWYLKLHGDLGRLQAGTYLFSPKQSVPSIVAQIAAGKVDAFNMTILPGKTLADIKQLLMRDGFAAADIDAAFMQHYNSPLLASKPASASLEGYIFPDTYQITSETTVPELLEQTFSTFYDRLQAAGLPEALAAKGFTLHQAITLASIIQQEASSSADRRQIAQVFEKRLANGMVLGSDVTFIYAAKQLGVAPSPTLDSPYNTRINTGLPPGAIGNFSLDAISAVANPAPGDYLYFVAGDDGTVHYAATEAEHEANVAKYCTKLCQ